MRSVVIRNVCQNTDHVMRDCGCVGRSKSVLGWSRMLGITRPQPLSIKVMWGAGGTTVGKYDQVSAPRTIVVNLL